MSIILKSLYLYICTLLYANPKPQPQPLLLTLPQPLPHNLSDFYQYKVITDNHWNNKINKIGYIGLFYIDKEYHNRIITHKSFSFYNLS